MLGCGNLMLGSFVGFHLGRSGIMRNGKHLLVISFKVKFDWAGLR